jgi:hypothetical protein
METKTDPQAALDWGWPALRRSWRVCKGLVTGISRRQPLAASTEQLISNLRPTPSDPVKLRRSRRIARYWIFFAVNL